MSWLFSQALVGEYSEASSLDGEQSAQSNGSHTQQAYCAPDKMTAFSRLSRFGMTFKPLTATHGEALLMSYLAAFRAKTSQPQGGGGGITGARSSMWKHMGRIIHEIRPKFVFVENSPNLTSRGLGVVLGDLATMGFDAKWGVLGAADVGAPHQRDRIWIFANNISDTNCESYAQRGIDHAVSETGGHGSVDKNGGGENVGGIIEPTKNETLETEIRATIGNKDWWIYESGFPRVVDGVAARVDRFKAIGNGQVPLCAATAWRILSEQ